MCAVCLETFHEFEHHHAVMLWTFAVPMLLALTHTYPDMPWRWMGTFERWRVAGVRSWRDICGCMPKAFLVSKRLLLPLLLLMPRQGLDVPGGPAFVCQRPRRPI